MNKALFRSLPFSCFFPYSLITLTCGAVLVSELLKREKTEGMSPKKVYKKAIIFLSQLD